MIIRPSPGFFATMAFLAAFAAIEAFLGGYWNFHARKAFASVFGFAIGVLLLWFSIQLVQRARLLAREQKMKKSAENK